MKTICWILLAWIASANAIACEFRYFGTNLFYCHELKPNVSGTVVNVTPQGTIISNYTVRIALRTNMVEMLAATGSSQDALRAVGLMRLGKEEISLGGFLAMSEENQRFFFRQTLITFSVVTNLPPKLKRIGQTISVYGKPSGKVTLNVAKDINVSADRYDFGVPAPHPKFGVTSPSGGQTH